MWPHYFKHSSMFQNIFSPPHLSKSLKVPPLTSKTLNEEIDSGSSTLTLSTWPSSSFPTSRPWRATSPRTLSCQPTSDPDLSIKPGSVLQILIQSIPLHRSESPVGSLRLLLKTGLLRVLVSVRVPLLRPSTHVLFLFPFRSSVCLLISFVTTLGLLITISSTLSTPLSASLPPRPTVVVTSAMSWLLPS